MAFQRRMGGLKLPPRILLSFFVTEAGGWSCTTTSRSCSPLWRSVTRSKTKPVGGSINSSTPLVISCSDAGAGDHVVD
jgi:hypothetical protein